MEHFNLTTNAATTMPVFFNANNTILVNGTEYILSSFHRAHYYDRDVHYITILTPVMMFWIVMFILAYRIGYRHAVVHGRTTEREYLRGIMNNYGLKLNDGAPKKAVALKKVAALKKELDYGAVDLEKADCTIPLLRGPVKGVAQK
jgi:hypothetical protein